MTDAGNSEKRIVINALQYKPEASGIAVLIRELFGRFAAQTKMRCTVVLPEGGPEFPGSSESGRSSGRPAEPAEKAFPEPEEPAEKYSDKSGKHAEKTSDSLAEAAEKAPASPAEPAEKASAGPEASADYVHAPCRYEQGIRRMWFQSFVMGPKYCKNAVLLTTDSKTPFFLPRSCVLVTLITDMAVFRLPETYQFTRVIWWKLQYKYLKHRADLILAMSESAKRDIMELLKIEEGRIRIIGGACGRQMSPVTDEKRLAAIREKYNLPAHYILFVGSFNPRKNLTRLIRAYDRAKVSQSLVIAGGQGWKFEKDEALEGVKRRDEICFPGFIPDEDMDALYSAADLFVFPSLYEGFGMPVLEAQSCGTPVLASDNSSLPEVGGDGALYVDAKDEENIAAGMERILTDELFAGKLVQKGFRNAEQFSWERSVEELEGAIRETISED